MTLSPVHFHYGNEIRTAPPNSSCRRGDKEQRRRTYCRPHGKPRLLKLQISKNGAKGSEEKRISCAAVSSRRRDLSSLKVALLGLDVFNNGWRAGQINQSRAETTAGHALQVGQGQHLLVQRIRCTATAPGPRVRGH